MGYPLSSSQLSGNWLITTKLFSLHTLDWPAVPFSSVVVEIDKYEKIRTTTLMMDDKAIELVKPNPHIFTEIIPRHPDWWILTVD